MSDFYKNGGWGFTAQDRDRIRKTADIQAKANAEAFSKAMSDYDRKRKKETQNNNHGKGGTPVVGYYDSDGTRKYIKVKYDFPNLFPNHSKKKSDENTFHINAESVEKTFSKNKNLKRFGKIYLIIMGIIITLFVLIPALFVLIPAIRLIMM